MKHLANIFNLWAGYFPRFMMYLAVEICLATIYIALGLAFLAFYLNLPPDTVSTVITTNKTALLMMVTSVAMAMSMIRFVTELISDGFDRPEHDNAPAKPKPQTEAA